MDIDVESLLISRPNVISFIDEANSYTLPLFLEGTVEIRDANDFSIVDIQSKIFELPNDKAIAELAGKHEIADKETLDAALFYFTDMYKDVDSNSMFNIKYISSNESKELYKLNYKSRDGLSLWIELDMEQNKSAVADRYVSFNKNKYHAYVELREVFIKSKINLNSASLRLLLFFYHLFLR